MTCPDRTAPAADGGAACAAWRQRPAGRPGGRGALRDLLAPTLLGLLALAVATLAASGLAPARSAETALHVPGSACLEEWEQRPDQVPFQKCWAPVSPSSLGFSQRAATHR